MNASDYLRYIVDEIHFTVVATVDDNGLPVTCAIDMMDYYPIQESISVLTVFQLFDGSGEWFDLSKKPIERPCSGS